MYLKNSIYKETLKIPKVFLFVSFQHESRNYETNVQAMSVKYESPTAVNREGLSKLQNRYSFHKTRKSQELLLPPVLSIQQSNQVKYPFMKLIKLCENSYFFGYCTRIGSGAKLTDNAYNENDTLFMGI